MVRAFRISARALVVLLALGAASPALAGDPAAPVPAPAADPIDGAATAFLEHLDRAEYGAAWASLHPDYQRLGTEERWSTNIAQARGKVGRLLSRQLSFRDIVPELPNRPPGSYLQIRFGSRFEVREAVLEVVTLKLVGESTWQVAGYILQ